MWSKVKRFIKAGRFNSWIVMFSYSSRQGTTPPHPNEGTALTIFEKLVSSLTFLIQSSPSILFDFFLEPFPETCIIKPYYDHHHTEYKTSAVHGYFSFPMLILQFCIVHWTSASMRLFSIQMENAFVYEITMKYIFIYSNSYNPPGYLPNSRDGRNHLLVISRAF
jgi:hypothetical protein